MKNSIVIDTFLLEKAFDDLNLPYPKDRIYSFYEKEQNIYCAIEYAKENMNAIIKMLPQGKVALNSEECGRLFAKLEIWIEYIAITTVGLGDVLATILKEVFELNVNRPYFHSMEEKLKQAKKEKKLAQKLSEKIGVIKLMDEYEVLKDFCNYVKHNNVVNTNIRITNINPFFRLTIKDFEYNKKIYTRMAVEEIFNISDHIHEQYMACWKIFIDYANDIR